MGKKSFYEHIEEIRKIIIKSAVAIFIFSILAYFFKKQMLDLITMPLNQKLVFLSPTEPFLVLMKLSMLVGVILAFPYIIYQIWIFIAEIFTPQTRKQMIKYIIASFFLFYGAIIFCYLAVLPIVIKFLINFENLPIISSITLTNYLSFVIYLLLGFGVLAQLPILLLSLINLNIVSVNYLAEKRRYIILIIFLVSAILTPPDAISLLLMALPMTILFEITLLIAKLKTKR